MEELLEGQKCIERVSRDTWHYSQCSNTAKVIRDRKPYCTVHDPERRKAKDAERERKYLENSCKKCHVHRSQPEYPFCPWCGTKYVS